MSEVDGQPRIRVLIVEDEDLLRDLLRIALSQHPRLEVVGAFADSETALEVAACLQPRVALLNVKLPGGLNGIEVGLRLRRHVPDLGIVLLSSQEDAQFVGSLPREAIAGWSYLLKTSVCDVEALGRAIEAAAAGLVALDPQLVMEMHHGAEGPLCKVTPRQREILGLIAEGFSNTAIAQRLVLAPKSVENQINLLYRALGIDEDACFHPRVRAALLFLRECQSRVHL